MRRAWRGLQKNPSRALQAYQGGAFVRKSLSMTGLLFLAPALLFVVAANVVPFVWNTVLSLLQWDGFGAPAFIGFENFKVAIADSLVISSLKNSMVYAFASTLGAVLLGLLMATLLFKLTGRGGAALRLILYSPSMIPTAVVGVMFVFFYNPVMGLLNNLLKLIGLQNLAGVWLQDKSTAMPCIIFVAIWKCAGSVMLLCYAAMQSIPGSLYESGSLDGAGYFTQMRLITYPLIQPMILLATINTLGSQFKSYDLIQTMTQGGPGNLTATVPIVMTKTAFNFGYFGRAAAQGVIFTLAVALSIAIVRRLLRGETYEF